MDATDPDAVTLEDLADDEVLIAALRHALGDTGDGPSPVLPT